MATEWFALISGKERGPFSLAELKEAAAKGKISENLPVKKGADGNWFPAKRIKGLPQARVVPPPRARVVPPPPRIQVESPLNHVRRRRYRKKIVVVSLCGIVFLSAVLFLWLRGPGNGWGRGGTTEQKRGVLDVVVGLTSGSQSRAAVHRYLQQHERGYTISYRS